MLRLSNLHVDLSGFTLRADFEVGAGQRIAIIGPSGAGKSTLLGAVAGFVPLKSGQILMEGRDVTGADPDKRGMAMLFQDGNLFPHLTLAQNVGLGLRPGLRLSDIERANVDEAIARVGLQGFGVRKPASLSGGQISRAALARVLLQARPLLLLDEPFAALGPALRAEMLALTSEVVTESGATMMMVTHAPLEVAEMVDDLIFVDAGDVAPPAPAATVLADPPPALRAYLGGWAQAGLGFEDAEGSLRRLAPLDHEVVCVDAHVVRRFLKMMRRERDRQDRNTGLEAHLHQPVHHGTGHEVMAVDPAVNHQRGTGDRTVLPCFSKVLCHERHLERAGNIEGINLRGGDQLGESVQRAVDDIGVPAGFDKGEAGVCHGVTPLGSDT